MRPVLLALVSALLFVVPAAAGNGAKELRGSIVALSANAVTVKDGTKSATCSLASTSPPLGAYRVGDRVTVACKRTGNHWTLLAIHRLATAKPKADQPAPKTSPTADGSFKQGGTLTDVSAASVTVRDGAHDFVCKLTDTSPPLAGFAVGDHVVIVCEDGALAGITKAPPTTEPKDPISRTGQGTLTALTTALITVHTDGGDVTCSLGDGSPKLGDFHVGDLVSFGCKGDVLFAIYKATTTPPPTTPLRRSSRARARERSPPSLPP